jgi:protein involved in polysaccharide export with SLBB domain
MRFRHFTIALAITLGLLFPVTRQSRAQTSDKSDKEDTFIYIFGEVNRPGSYLIKVKDKATLRWAILIAGGTTNEAMTRFRYTTILREPEGGGRRKQIRVDLSAVMEGNVEDIPLADDDIIFVDRDRNVKPKDGR